MSINHISHNETNTISPREKGETKSKCMRVHVILDEKVSEIQGTPMSYLEKGVANVRSANWIGGCFGACICTGAKRHNVSYIMSKTMALIFQFVTVVLILIIQSTDLSSWLDSVSGTDECKTDEECYVRQAAYRVGFSGTLVFLFHLVILCFRISSRMLINSYWAGKIVFLVGVSGLFLLVPNVFFSVWGGIAEVLSGGFLFLQMVWILDLGYTWSDKWTSKAQDKKVMNRTWRHLYFGIFSISVGLVVLAYLWFGLSLRASYADLHANRAIMWINLVACTALVVGSIFSPKGSVLPTCLLMLYIAYLSWSIGWSGEGNDNVTSDGRLAVSLILALATLVYATIRTNLPHIRSTINFNQDASKTVVYPPAPVSRAGTVADPVAKAVTIEAPEQKGMDSVPRHSTETIVVDKPESEENVDEGTWMEIAYLNVLHITALSYLMSICLSWKKSPQGPDTMVFYWVQAAVGWAMIAIYGWIIFHPLVRTAIQRLSQRKRDKKASTGLTVVETTEKKDVASSEQ